jgi:hypothetical protein
LIQLAAGNALRNSRTEAVKVSAFVSGTACSGVCSQLSMIRASGLPLAAR